LGKAAGPFIGSYPPAPAPRPITGGTPTFEEEQKEEDNGGRCG